MGSRICWIVIVVFMMEGKLAAFNGKECLDIHNKLRKRHDQTQPLKYSKELEKSAQVYADKLAELDDDKSNPFPTRDLPKRRRRDIAATTKPYFHKEMWDGEIIYPSSEWDLNKDEKTPIGESIHKFCCYSFPYCPSDVFHGLNFPPSAKGVVDHFYKEMSNYDFERGKKKDESEEIKHFANIVWKKTSEVGCAQSKRSKRHCIYTVTRYREGSVGFESDYKDNIGSTTPADRSKDESSQSYLTAFLAAIFVVLILVVVVIVYIKRHQIRSLYAEYQIKRGARKAEASLRDDYDEESFNGKKSIIYKPSSKKHRPSIRVIQNVSPTSTLTLPLKPRNPTQNNNRVSIAYNADSEQCSVIRNDKPLPPRPSSAAQATPPLRPPSQSITSGRGQHPPHPMHHASLPPPPPPSKQVTSDPAAASILDNSQQQNKLKTSNPPSDVNKAVGQAGKQQNEQKSAIDIKKQFEAKKPLPVPAKRPLPNTAATNGIPKPAPRPIRSRPPDDQQFESRPLAGRPARASRKNPNFRTLPLNESMKGKGTLKAESKPSESGKMDWRSNLNKVSGSNDNKRPGNLPVLPEGKKIQEGKKAPESKKVPEVKKVPVIPRKIPAKKTDDTDRPFKKPLLPKRITEEKETDSDRPMSISERKRLLESKDRK